MKNNKKTSKDINLDEDWEDFIKEEGLIDYNKIPVQKAEIKGWVQIAFWFLRVYILVLLKETNNAVASVVASSPVQ